MKNSGLLIDRLYRVSFVLLLLGAVCALLPSGVRAEGDADTETLARTHEAARAAVTADSCREHEEVLTSDEIEGREAGSAGGAKAGLYIAKRCDEYGLEPIGEEGTYFQPFSGGGSAALGDGNTLTVTHQTATTPDGDAVSETQTFSVPRDYNLFSFSKNKNIENATLVFAGYGITAPEYEYDDYADIDVEGAVVLIFRHEPQVNDPRSVFNGREYTDHATFIVKAQNASEHGAVAMLLVNRPSMRGDSLMTYDNPIGGGNSNLAALHVKKDTAAALVGETVSLTEIENAVNGDLKPRSFFVEGATVSLKTSLEVSTARNVVAWLPGTDEELAEEHIIVGAHYDHLGYGRFGALDRSRELHRGADDNASGSTAILELARILATAGPKLRRSVLFIWFDGEEKGLLGSRHYAQNPIKPLANAIAMVNLDMVGRVRDGDLDVGATQSSPDWEAIVDAAEENTDLTITRSRGVAGNSDHASFYQEGVPCVFLFTGMHSEYHTASDTLDTINLDGLAEVTRVAYDLVTELDARDERLRFNRVSRPTRSRARLGIVPNSVADIPEDLDGGVVVGQISPGSAAAEGGMESGDVITKMDDTTITSLDDLIGFLSDKVPGDRVMVEVYRDGETITLNLTLGGR